MKNEFIDLDWKEHSSYYTQGEAKQKSIRLEMFTGKPTKLVKDDISNRWRLMVGYNPRTRKINKGLDIYG